MPADLYRPSEKGYTAGVEPVKRSLDPERLTKQLEHAWAVILRQRCHGWPSITCTVSDAVGRMEARIAILLQ